MPGAAGIEIVLESAASIEQQNFTEASRRRILVAAERPHFWHAFVGLPRNGVSASRYYYGNEQLNQHCANDTIMAMIEKFRGDDESKQHRARLAIFAAHARAAAAG